MRKNVSAIFLFISVFGTVNAQDALSIFFNHENESGIVGGNPFVSLDENTNEEHEGVLLHNTQKVFIRYNYLFDNVYKEERSDGVNAEAFRRYKHIEVFAPLLQSDNTGALRIDVRSTKTSASFPVVSGRPITYQNEIQDVTLGLSIPINTTMNWNVAIAQGHSGDGVAPNYETGIEYYHPNVLASIKFKNQSSSQFVSANISGINGILPLDVLQQGTELTLAVPMDFAILRLSFYDNDMYPVSHFFRENDTHFNPKGKSRGYTSSAVFTLSKNLSALASIEVESIQGGGTFYSRSVSYGYLNSFLLTNTSYLFGVKYRPTKMMVLISDIKWQSLSGEASGSAENWPFVSILQSSFSYGYFNGTGSIKILKLHVGGSFPINEFFAPGLGINFVHMLPNLHVSTWQSRFLSIGERNRQSISIPYKELDGLILSSGLKCTLSRFELLYSLSQMIPVRAVKLSEQKQSVAQSAGNSTPMNIHSSGGQFHQLSIALNF